jgi:hypothetical protein
MNHDFEIKLQAWLDGELPEEEASSFLLTAKGDPQAMRLLDELKAVKTALSDNEIERPVPASREFYWSQIQSQIRRQETVSLPSLSRLGSLLVRWRRLLAPMTGAALGAVLLAVTLNHPAPYSGFVETTDTSSEFDALTFHDQASGMTVVWLKYREKQPSDSTADADVSFVP